MDKLQEDQEMSVQEITKIHSIQYTLYIYCINTSCLCICWTGCLLHRNDESCSRSSFASFS